MTVKIRPYRKGGWEIDIMILLDNGQRYRERRKAPVSSKSAALRWGEKRERYLLTHGPDQGQADSPELEQGDVKKQEVPTFAEFAPRYLVGCVQADRLSPSTQKSYKKNLRVHVLPAFGSRRLDDLTNEDIQRLKADRSHLSPSTMNGILKVMRGIYKSAINWGVIEARPVELRLLRESSSKMEFFEFDEFEALVEAAAAIDWRTLLLVLLGGEAGLRSGEIRGLQWSSIDMRRRLITVERSLYEGQLTLPKHNKIRTVPMTDRLARALTEHRHDRGLFVLYLDDGYEYSTNTLARWLEAACKRAEIRYRSPHSLRHTFCSHLAMRSAPALAIKTLAGHGDLKMTQRYMHLTPAALVGAIQLLNKPAVGNRGLGDMVETGLEGPRGV